MTKLQRSHINLVRAISALPANRILGDADAADIEARVDHYRAVYSACIRYIDQAVADVLNHVTVGGDADTVAVRTILFDCVSDDFDFIRDLERAGVTFADLQTAEAA